MSIVEQLPGTLEWLLRAIDLRVQFRFREILRGLEAKTDARLVVLWAVTHNVHTTRVEFAGDDTAMPRPFPELRLSVVDYTTVRGADGEEHDAAVHLVRVGRDVPRLGLVVLDPGDGRRSELTDALLRTGAAIEKVLVHTLAARR